MNPIEWLESRVDGFRDLPQEDRQAIFHFALLWSFYEAKVHGTNGSASKILAKVHEWAAQGKLNPSEFSSHLEYFRSRYFADGVPSHHFSGLELRRNDCRELVGAVLSGTNNDAADCLAALLVVVYRLRNNLFHGSKWDYGIQGQLDNFKQANALLVLALEIEGL